jgi:hypothetical protein
VLSGLTISPSTFRAAPALPHISRARVGTTIAFTLSEAATVKLGFMKVQPGRLVSGRCTRPAGWRRAKPSCTRYVTVGDFSVHGHRGPNAVAFSGALSRTKRLGPGVYRLTATPTDSARRSGRPRTATLTIAAR